MRAATLISPLGPLTLTEADGQITALDWRAAPGEASSLLTEALAQLAAYFERRLTRFDLPLHFGTGLNEQVRRAMFAIPFGDTRTYGDLARALKTQAQAVGQACGANPIPILIPCHRVLASGGRLGGFSGGLDWKRRLLAAEGVVLL